MTNEWLVSLSVFEHNIWVVRTPDHLLHPVYAHFSDEKGSITNHTVFDTSLLLIFLALDSKELAWIRRNLPREQKRRRMGGELTLVVYNNESPTSTVQGVSSIQGGISSKRMHNSDTKN